MDVAEWEETAECVDCGAPVVPSVDEGYAFGEGLVLCFACATRRGGVYDAERDEWVTAPTVAGVDDRAPNAFMP